MKSLIGHLRDLSGMGVASVAATFCDWMAFSALLRLMAAHVSVAAALAAAVGAVIHFSLCRSWVFGRFSTSFMTAAPRYLLVSGVALVLHTAIVTGLGHGHHIQSDTAWLISKITVFALWCYPASRYLVFAVPARSAAPRVDLEHQALS